MRSRMSSVIARSLVAALVAAAACGRSPRAVRETDSVVEDAMTARDAGTYDGALGRVGEMNPQDDEVAVALEQLRGHHRQQWARARQWLIEHPERSRPAVVALVETMGLDVGVKRAIAILGEIGDPADVPLLARGIASANEVLRHDFGHALALHDSPAALDALRDAATSDDVKTVTAALAGLGERGDESARALVEEHLDHESVSVRLRAVLALVDLGAAPSRVVLERRQKVEKDPDVRDTLRKALGDHR